MKRTLQVVRWFGIAVAILVIATCGNAQTLSVSATTSLPQFQLTADPTPASPLTVRASWSGFYGLFNQLTVSVCVYMSAPMSGTGVNTDTIPASAVQVNGSSMVTGTTNCGVPGAALVGSEAHNCFITCGGSPDDYNVNVRLAGYSPALSADTYTGTINLIAQAQY
jgi:hypothetical protein